jgi:hypothetical protein
VALGNACDNDRGAREVAQTLEAGRRVDGLKTHADVRVKDAAAAVSFVLRQTV